MAYLRLTKGYEVVGTSRDAQLAWFSNLVHLGVRDRVPEIEVAPGQFIANRPNCAGKTRIVKLLDRLRSVAPGLDFGEAGEGAQGIGDIDANAIGGIGREVDGALDQVVAADSA